MVFDPNTQTLKCEHCGNTLEIVKDKDVVEHDIAEGFAAAETVGADEQAAYRCDNCGANVVMNADEIANICPFCGTSHIAKLGSFSGLRPQVVVPFCVGASDAAEFAKKWAKKRIFAPRKFKKSLSPDKTHGVYEPCFTFDSDTFSTYVGRVGDRHTRTVGSGKNRRTETYIVYRHVSGTYSKFFDDVTVAANDNFTQKELRAVSPFRLSDACVYESKYLSGFVAEKYNKDLPESWNDAKKMMDETIRENIKNSLHCDVIDYLNISTRHSSVTYKYVLLPVYVISYTYGGKRYGIKVNGSTGKAHGKTPLSPVRVAIAAVIGAAAVVGIIALLVHFYSTGELTFSDVIHKIFAMLPLK